MAKKRISVRQIATEFFSVVFAVLLALALNSYKQERDLKKETTILSEKIIIECQKNLEKLDSVIIENTAFKFYLDSITETNVDGGFRLAFSSELLTQSAWEYTQASKSYTYVPKEFLDDAIELYEIQSFYMEISNNMIDNMGQMLLLSDQVETKTMLIASRYYLTNILNASSQLKESYIEFLMNHNQ